ncbi:Spy/CpxP family protein refolding chaperone [Starkeya koreensis]|uniref:Spy/CpxP family protein refolding chaperone n=1 Tax=Ancylobacter koreensis TaxID=266121 RepID=A0ABT0DLK3_9HYPH|nr:Spy/CpxP family protein refolding chaperone [Ancylobacter koreensis]MCK0208074.1 Spy/CpxP family protein refolding chaperone [Ancylobacter koreensis]
MKRTIIAATAAALLASVTFGIAAPELRSSERPRPTPEQIAEFAGAMSDARIAALKAGLRLDAEQEKLWPALESALRESAQERIDQRAERRAEKAERSKGERPDVVQRLQARADDLLEKGGSLKKLAEAAGPLYVSLDEGQKRRFAILFKQAERPHMAFAGDRHERGPHRFGPQGGPGRPGPDGPMHHRLPPPGGPDMPGPQGEPL